MFDPHNQAVQSFRSRAESVRKGKDEQRQETEEQLRKAREENQLLRIAFKVSNKLPLALASDPGSVGTTPLPNQQPTGEIG